MTWYQKTTNKYHNKSTEYGGSIFDSKLEAGYAEELDIRKMAGDIKDWERQIKISLDINGVHLCNYYVDFLIHHNDGTKEYVEIKGFETPIWRLKWKIFEAYYGDLPDTTLTVIKQKSNWKAKFGSYKKQ